MKHIYTVFVAEGSESEVKNGEAVLVDRIVVEVIAKNETEALAKAKLLAVRTNWRVTDAWVRYYPK